MLSPVHQVGLSFTTIPGHSICSSTSQTIQTPTSTAILGRSADLPLLGLMKRFMQTEALSFCLPLLLIFPSHSPTRHHLTTWPTGLHKCAMGGGGLFTTVESSNNIARFRLCIRHIPDPRIVLPVALVQSSTISFRTHFLSAVRRYSERLLEAEKLGWPDQACYGM